MLVADLGDMLADTPADPLTPDLVAVPTPGIERFISQGLGLRLGAAPGRADGVCANVDFPSPARIVNRVIAQATGVSADQDPWLTHRVVWPLLAVMDESAGEPWCHPLARHLGLDPTVGAPEWERLDRRFAVAARLARLFSAYASQRPSLLLDWAAGSNGEAKAKKLSAIDAAAKVLIDTKQAMNAKELIEAARVDGAGHAITLIGLIVPLSVPAIASLGIFQFMWIWNDYLIALIFAGRDKAPVTMKLAQVAGERGNAWHLLTAAGMVSMILPICVFFALQRYFVRGLLAGAVKG